MIVLCLLVLNIVYSDWVYRCGSGILWPVEIIAVCQEVNGGIHDNTNKALG